MWDVILAFIYGVGIVGLVWWLRSRNIVVKWYDWLIGAIGLLFIAMAYQHFLGELWEGLTQAAWMGLLILGGIGIVLLVATSLQVWRRNRRLA